MRGMYSITFGTGGTGIVANNADGNFDWFELDPAADKPIEIVAIFIGQTSETGDTAEELLNWSIKRFSGGTFTSGGEASVTPTALSPADGASSATCESFNSNGSAASSSGTTVTLHMDAFNIRTGLQVIFPPELRPSCDGAAQSAIVVRCESTVADDITMYGTLYFRELT